MSPHFDDLLTTLFVPRPGGGLSAPAECKSAFRAYLAAAGVETFNYGSFTAGPQGLGRRWFGDAVMPKEWQSEYLERGFIRRDFVLNRAMLAARTGHFSNFRFGGWLAPRLEGSERPSAAVLRGAAAAGMADGVGIVGTLPAPGRADRTLVWGVALGGGQGIGDHIAEQLPELEIAASALMQRLAPELRRNADGVKVELTPREREVLAHLAEGERRDRIGERLGIALPTVDLHVANLRRKLRARTACDAVAKALRYGFL